MNMDEIERIYNLSKLDKNKKKDLEDTLNSGKLDWKQGMNLIGTCYIYSNMSIKLIHKKKYDSYEISDFVKEVISGKTPLEIVSNIIDECEKNPNNFYNTFTKDLGPMDN